MAGSQINVAGPATMLVLAGLGAAGDAGVGGGRTPSILGTAIRTPVIEILPEWTPAYADTTGRRVPFDELRDAEHALIRADLNMFDRAVYATIAGKAGSSAGTINNIGAMFHLEGYSVTVTVQLPYLKTAYTFPACTLTNPERLDDLAATAMILGVIFHAVIKPGTKTLYTTASM